MFFRIASFLILFQFGLSTRVFGQKDKFSLDAIKELAESQPLQAYQELELILKNAGHLDEFSLAEARFLEGSLLLEFGLFNEATIRFFEAESLFQQLPCKSCLGELYNQIGKLYYKSNSIAEALKNHQKSLSLFEQLDDQKGIAKSKGLIGSMHEKLGEYDMALNYQNEAIFHSRQVNDSSHLAVLYENIGSIYEDLEQFDSAERYFQLALELNQSQNVCLNIPGNLNNLGDTRRKTGRSGESIPFYQEALKISQNLGNTYQERSAAIDLSKAYSNMGNYQEAYEWLANARELSEQLFSEEAAKILVEKELQFEIMESRKEIEHLENVQLFESRIRWLLFILILSLAGLSWGWISRQRMKLKAHHQTVIKQKELLKIKEQLIQTEKENVNLLEARMSTEVHAHQKALSAQTLHVIEKNQILREIQAKIKSILDLESKDQKKRLRNLVKQIEYNLGQDKDWESFKATFENVHQDFLKNLSTKNPELTAGDIKLACLMKMNLSSKEIAATLGISMESLRISKYRLRKRLQLEVGSELQKYLHCL